MRAVAPFDARCLTGDTATSGGQATRTPTSGRWFHAAAAVLPALAAAATLSHTTSECEAGSDGVDVRRPPPSGADVVFRTARLLRGVGAMIFEYARVDVAAAYAAALPRTADADGPAAAVRRAEEELRVLQEAYTGDRSDRGAAHAQLSETELREEVHRAADALGAAEEALRRSAGTDAAAGPSTAHVRAAAHLLALCRANGGAYVKVGQHLANLDPLLPPGYAAALQPLFDDAPRSDYADVREVVKEELGAYPEEIFGRFDVVPIASASLAQVHVATDRDDPSKIYAVKVQHRGLREKSAGDVWAAGAVVTAVEGAFKDFRFGWLAEEIAPQIFLELDFENEARNSEAAAAHLAAAGLGDECVIPDVIWKHTSPRVLCMAFEPGFKVTDLGAIGEADLDPRDVSRLVKKVFNTQIFHSGFVHCDPHPANVLIRRHPRRAGRPQMVLVDHGLYKRIDDHFRITYARLWRALFMADLAEIKAACGVMGITDMYPLLAAMLTARPFDEILERSDPSRYGTTGASPSGPAGDSAMLRGYARKYAGEIVAMLDAVPRQMLLLFKTNDCLRHIDRSLGRPHADAPAAAGGEAARAVLQHELAGIAGGDVVGAARRWTGYAVVIFRVWAYGVAVNLGGSYKRYIRFIRQRGFRLYRRQLEPSSGAAVR